MLVERDNYVYGKLKRPNYSTLEFYLAKEGIEREKDDHVVSGEIILRT